MLHIVKQYRQLFMGFMSNKLEGYNKHISDVTKDGDLTLRETKKVNALIGDTNKFEKALASFDYKNIDVEEDAQKRIKEYRKKYNIIIDDFISNVDNIKDGTIKQKNILSNEVRYNIERFNKIDKTIGGLDQASPEQVKLYQLFLIGMGYDLGKYGPNGDGVDGKKGTKASLTYKAYNNYKLKIKELKTTDEIKELKTTDEVKELKTTDYEKYGLGESDLKDINFKSLKELIDTNKLRAYNDDDKKMNYANFKKEYDAHTYWKNIGYKPDGIFGPTELAILNKVRDRVLDKNKKETEKNIIDLESKETGYKNIEKSDTDLRSIDELMMALDTAFPMDLVLEVDGPSIDDSDKIIYGNNLKSEYEKKYKCKVINEVEDDYGELIGFTIEKKVTINNVYDLVKEYDKDSQIADKMKEKLAYEDGRGILSKIGTGFGDIFKGDFDDNVINVIKNRKDNIYTLLDNIDNINFKFEKGEITLEKEKNELLLSEYKNFLFDMDGDTMLSTEMRDQFTEIGLDTRVNTLEEFKTLLGNLNLKIDDVSKDFGFKEKFVKNIINLITTLKIPKENLLVEGGVIKFNKLMRAEVDKQNEKIEEVKEKIAKFIKDGKYDSELEKKLEKLKLTKDGTELANDKDKTNIEALRRISIGILAGCKKGAGVDIDISDLTEVQIGEFTTSIIDGIGIGYVDGKFYPEIRKNILDAEFKQVGMRLDLGTTFTGLGIALSLHADTHGKESTDAYRFTYTIGTDGESVGHAISIKGLSTDNYEGFNRNQNNKKEKYLKFLDLVEGGDMSLLTKTNIYNFYGEEVSDEVVERDIRLFAEFEKEYNFLLSQGITTEQLKSALVNSIVNGEGNKVYDGQTKGLKLTGITAFTTGILTGAFLTAEYNYINFSVNSNELRDEVTRKVTKRDLSKAIENKDIKGIEMGKDSIIINNDKDFNITLYDHPNIVIKEGKNGKKIYKAKEGYILETQVNSHMSANEEKNNTTLQNDITIRAIAINVDKDAIANMLDSSLKDELRENLYTKLQKYEKGFNEKTRYNDISKIIGKNNSVEKRWDAFIELSDKVEKLKDLKTLFTQIDKKYKDKEGYTQIQIFLLTTLSQYTSKSVDISKDTIDEYINTDKNRNTKFDKLLKTEGFKVSDARNEIYDKVLEERGKGLSFKSVAIDAYSIDVRSTLHAGPKGETVKNLLGGAGKVEVLADKKGNPILAEMSKEQAKTFIAKIPKEYLKVYGLDEEDAKYLVEQGVLTLSLAKDFQGDEKDQHGFDDMLVMQIASKEDMAKALANSSRYQSKEGNTATYTESSDLIDQENRSVQIFAGVACCDDKDNGDKQSSETGTEEGEDGGGLNGGGNDGTRN